MATLVNILESESSGRLKERILFALQNADVTLSRLVLLVLRNLMKFICHIVM